MTRDDLYFELGTILREASYALLRIRDGEAPQRSWLEGAIAVCEQIELGRQIHRRGLIKGNEELQAAHIFKPANREKSLLETAGLQDLQPLLGTLKKLEAGKALPEAELDRALEDMRALADACAEYNFAHIQNRYVAESVLGL